MTCDAQLDDALGLRHASAPARRCWRRRSRRPAGPRVIMLLTALPPAPPTPNTVIRGFSSGMSGILRLMVMFASRSRARGFAAGLAGPPPDAGEIDDCGMRSSEALAKPSSDPSEVAARPCHQLPRLPRFDMFEMRDLRIDQQAGRRPRRPALLAASGSRPKPSGRPMRTGPAENPRREFRRGR